MLSRSVVPARVSKSVNIVLSSAPRLFRVLMMAASHKERTSDNYRSNTLHTVTVDSITDLSDTVKGFDLTVSTDNKDFTFLPGQWLDVHVPNGDETVIGGYSITSSPNQFVQSGVVGLAIQYSDHPPTNWMHKVCAVGTQLKVRVGGDFYYDPAPSKLSDLLLVAGGIDLSRQPPGNVLLYSAKDNKELIFRKDIEDLVSSRNELFKRWYFCSRDVPTDPTIKDHRITESDIKGAVESLDHTHLQCYICGPPPLINFVTETLTKLGITRTAIHYEKWW